MAPVHILCIETALSGCSVCLAEPDRVLGQAISDIPNSASDKLPGLVDAVLKETGLTFRDIGAIAVSNGPGSYTGLRIGVAAAKGYSYALQIPVIPISTLQIMAAAARDRYGIPADTYVPALDARRNEIFWGMYDKDLNCTLDPSPMILGPDVKNRFDTNQNFCLTGSGTAKLAAEVQLPNLQLLPDSICLASDMTALAFTEFHAHHFAHLATWEPGYTKEFYYPGNYIKKN